MNSTAYKENIMANAKVLSPEGRFRWMKVFTAEPDMNGKMVKSGTLLIPKTSSLKPLQDAWDTAAKEEFQGKIPGSLRKLVGGQKPILKDGDEHYSTRDEDKQEMYEAYQGCWVLACSCDENAPLRILGPDSTDVYDPAEIYDGAYGQFVINFSCYQSKPRPAGPGKPGYPGGPMCSVSLLGVRKTRDGEPIETGGSGVRMTDEDMERFFGAGAGSTRDGLDDL